MIELSEIQRLFDVQRNHRHVVKAATGEQRIQRLRSLREQLLAHEKEIAQAIYDDLGRPLDNRDEFDTVLGNIEKAENELAQWMAPVPVEKSPSSPEAHSIFIKYEPRGNVLLFGTWDFPIGMFFSPLIAAITAGNVVIAKTSSLTPASGQVICDVVRAAFDEAEVAVINDTEVSTPDGTRRTNDVLLDMPFDHVFLTGSPRVGREIVAKAAKNLTSFTLELGGKSPAILDATADLDAIMPHLIFGKNYNHGQTCLTVDYLWLPTAMRETFIEKYVAAVRETYYVGDDYQWERDARFVNKKNFDRVRGYLDDAVARGAKVAFGGQADEEHLVIEPTVLTDVPAEAEIVREEIFGPILPIFTYDDEQEIYAHFATLGKPLASTSTRRTTSSSTGCWRTARPAASRSTATRSPTGPSRTCRSAA